MDEFYKIIDYDTKSFSKFISVIIKKLNIKLNTDVIEKEIHSQFSFYWYHYLSCQLDWLKWWQLKLKDNDLLLIALQATIPTLQYIGKMAKEVSLDEVFTIIGKINKKSDNQSFSVSATSVSEITGIPRATCIRKLDKLVNLGFLIRELKTKRYEVNQSTESRTKNIMNKDNVTFTIETFSEYIAIILNSLIRGKNSLTG